MIEKLNEIKKFLELNKQYNHELQQKFAQKSLTNAKEPFDKLVALLYDTIDTQSRPNINRTYKFMTKIFEAKDSLDSFDGFFEFIVHKSVSEFNNKNIYEQLFSNMKKQSGWGPKTSALLIKNIYNYHHSFDIQELKIWNDVPKVSDNNDILNVPVDAVIFAIFMKLDSKTNFTFEKINKILQDNFTNNEIILFDDLWFWGFITQKGGRDRTYEWNEEKYWSIKESQKDENILKNIREKSLEFTNILTSN